MTFKRMARFLKKPAVTMGLIAALVVAGLTTIPEVRSNISGNLEQGTDFFLFDGDGSDTNADGSKKQNTFKRIVSAPVRLMARLFRRKNDDNFAMKKLSEKDLAKMKVVPMNREQNGLPGQIADAGGSVTTEMTTAEAAAQNLFDEAVLLHEKGKLDSAIEKLVAATVINPQSAEAYNLLAVCYDGRGQYLAAQEEYKKALKLDSDNARFINNIGYSCYLSGDYKNAIKWYRKGIKVTPNDRRMHNNIGLAYGRKGDYKKAREHFVIAVGETGADLNLGYVYSQEGRFDDAIKHYESALAAQPQSLPAMSNLAQLYDRTGRIREAAMLNEQYKKLAQASQQKDQTADQQQ